MADPSFLRLKATVIAGTGMAFYEDKDAELADILAARMEARGIRRASVYGSMLRQDPAEFDALVAELTVGETYFFRHKEQFDALREVVIPQVIHRNRPTRRLRIWSAGCATGPEPYSVAILLDRDFGMELDGWHVTILGTDINRKFLADAQTGVFGPWAFRGTADDIRTSHFTPQGDRWQVNPRHKARVTFQHHNLITGEFPSIRENIAAFDIILCRNVIIYFSPDVVETLIPRFFDSLNPGGWLIMGHAEPNQRLFSRFRTVDAAGAVVYQRDADSVGATVPPDPGFVPTGPSGEPRLPVALPAGEPPVPPAPSAAGAGQDVDAVLARVKRLADGGEWEAAAIACDALLAGAPLVAHGHFYRALIHHQVGEVVAAEASLRRAIYLDRRMVLPHYHLGLVLADGGDGKGAAKAFRNALKLLSPMPDGGVVAMGEKITAGHLREAVAMRMRLLGGRE